MNKFGRAQKEEQGGNYREAASLYARSAFDGLVDSNFQQNRKIRIKLAELLLAISCDVRANNQHRAKYLFDITRPLLEEISDSADNRVLVGLSKEWIGDGLLMLGLENAIDMYSTAGEYYDNLGWKERSWGHEQEFHYAFIAFEGFLASNGIEVPKKPHLPLDFTSRIQFKADTAKLILD